MIPALPHCDNLSTPCYVYNMELLRRTLAALNEASSVDSRFMVHYALKANSNAPILRLISGAGLGADCVSGPEIETAVANGFAPGAICFAGVGKSDGEIRTALACGIGCFNVESLQELEVINSIAASMDKIAPVALRINPEVDAHTHRYITTGMRDNKFGIQLKDIDRAMKMVTESTNLQFKGLHFHIGSQMLDMEPCRLLCERIIEIVGALQSQGYEVDSVNVGGGLGVDYENPHANPVPDFAAYFNTFAHGLEKIKVSSIQFELGRSVVAQCGSLLTRVLYIKEGEQVNFAIVDAGMNDLIRPALYEAYHSIERIVPPTVATDMLEPYDVVGPVCESSDTFGRDRMLPHLQRGDLLAVRSAGAYGQTMASNYNLRPLAHTLYI